MGLNPTFADCAESALLVNFGTQYDRALSLAILHVWKGLHGLGLPGLRESVPALTSLTVFYDPLSLPREKLIREISALCEDTSHEAAASRSWRVPVVYGGEGGPDLESVALEAGMSTDDVIGLHSARDYHVYMLGFLPGFAYLGDLPQELALPRRSTPRARVPAGSVAIAAGLTAIYPLESPGGWHVIGSTPIILWNMARQEHPLFLPGDRVRFEPILADEAARLATLAAEGAIPMEELQP